MKKAAILFIEDIEDQNGWWLSKALASAFPKAIYLVGKNLELLVNKLSPLEISRFFASILGQDCSIVVCADILVIKVLSAYNLGIVIRPNGGEELGARCLVYEPEGLVNERDRIVDMVLAYLKKEKIITGP